jgi:3-oxoadipate enol-lactonase
MEQIVSIGGRRVRYLEEGRGAPLLLLHAFPLNAEMWRPQLEAVPEGWRFIAPDLAGFGGSERRGDAAPSMDGYAADALALLDTLGAGRVTVAGLSMGGYVAFGVLRAAPARVRALVLADTRAEADGAEARENRAKMLTVLGERGPRGVADAMLPKLLAGDDPGLRAQVRRLIEGNQADGLRDAILALRDRPDATALLEGLDLPALVMAGDADEVTPPALHEAMHRALPQSRLAVLPGAGHLSNLERPAQFTTALSAFLLSLPPV